MQYKVDYVYKETSASGWEAILNERQQEGWEFACAIPVPRELDILAVFKRYSEVLPNGSTIQQTGILDPTSGILPHHENSPKAVKLLTDK